MRFRFFRKYDVQIGAAIALLVFGMALTLMAFVTEPFGEVPESTQAIFGRCLIFSGSMLGVGAYVNARLTEFDKKLGQRKGGEDVV